MRVSRTLGIDPAILTSGVVPVVPMIMDAEPNGAEAAQLRNDAEGFIDGIQHDD